MNRGAWVSAERSKVIRAGHRILIKSLPNYRTGFTRHDIPLDVSVARRELQEMTKDGLLLVTKLKNGANEYRKAPDSLMRLPWVKNDSAIRLGCYYPRVGM